MAVWGDSCSERRAGFVTREDRVGNGTAQNSRLSSRPPRPLYSSEYRSNINGPTDSTTLQCRASNSRCFCFWFALAMLSSPDLSGSTSSDSTWFTRSMRTSPKFVRSALTACKTSSPVMCA
mmetsp:Transcript_10334/g.17337  ORF Transcript_10334/g.17337 Transcript_10334/m.17337 type:complete len:121 (-) Transcript_10334:377-739(-)